MSAPKSLPSTMVMLAYLAAGSAISCSYFMMYQVTRQLSGLDGGALGYLLPAAILFSSAVLWRLVGHLHRRQMVGVLAIIIPSALFLEAGSIATSYISITMGVEQKRIDERQASSSHQAAEQTSRAASVAAARLAANIERMPANYRTASANTAAQLQSLLDSQQKLIETQANAAVTTSAMSMLDDDLLVWWAIAIALALTISVLAVQVGLGAASDGAHQQRHGLQNIDTRGDDSGRGNGASLRAVK